MKNLKLIPLMFIAYILTLAPQPSQGAIDRIEEETPPYSSSLMIFGTQSTPLKPDEPDLTGVMQLTGAREVSPKKSPNSLVLPIVGYSRGQVQGDNPPRCRIHPIKKRRKTHAGCDMAIRKGTGVQSVLPGKVVFSGQMGGYGNIITIQHKLPSGKIVYSRYAHLHKGKGCSMIKKGATVSAGTRIGCVGNTGLSSGPHLHFEIRGSASGGAIYDSRHFLLNNGELRKAKTC